MTLPVSIGSNTNWGRHAQGSIKAAINHLSNRDIADIFDLERFKRALAGKLHLFPDETCEPGGKRKVSAE